MAQCDLMADPVPARVASASDRFCRMLEAVQALAPLIAGQRDDFDGGRRLPDAVIGALANAGLFRLWLPEGRRHLRDLRLGACSPRCARRGEAYRDESEQL